RDVGYKKLADEDSNNKTTPSHIDLDKQYINSKGSEFQTLHSFAKRMPYYTPYLSESLCFFPLATIEVSHQTLRAGCWLVNKFFRLIRRNWTAEEIYSLTEAIFIL